MNPSTSPAPPPVRVAVIGLGGFAQVHHRSIHALEREGLCRLIATCDPAPDTFREWQEKCEFEARGVRVYDHYVKMLDGHGGDLDLVTIPTPIPLHAEMHRACVERGRTAYLEKPPSLDPDEFDGMLAVERRAARPTVIGFQMMSDPARQALKRRIAAGEFGRVRRVSFLGLWPRSSVYYRRNQWAGRLRMDGRLVLDSCFGNAMAHYLNNCCCWAGEDAPEAWRAVESLEAELYRAHPIEGADTLFARGRFAGGAELRLALSHACAGAPRQRELVECERATIEYVNPTSVRLLRPGAEPETMPPSDFDLWTTSFRTALAYVSGRAARPFQKLAESDPFVRLNGLAYAAAGRIRTVRPPHAVVSKGTKGDTLVSIENLADAAEAMERDGRLPSEQGAPWAAPGGSARAADLARLRATVDAMADARGGEEGGFKAY